MSDALMNPLNEGSTSLKFSSAAAAAAHRISMLVGSGSFRVSLNRASSKHLS